jgi:ATP phosphoribosyltransferase
VILDIVESGSTLKANGLEILEEICVISARLVVNRVALKTKRSRIQAIVEGFQSQLPEMKQE